MRLTDGLLPGERIEVKVVLHPNGALSVEGPIHDKRFCVAILQNAIDAVRNHGMRRELVVPERDVVVPLVAPKKVDS